MPCQPWLLLLTYVASLFDNILHLSCLKQFCLQCNPSTHFQTWNKATAGPAWVNCGLNTTLATTDSPFLGRPWFGLLHFKIYGNTRTSVDCWADSLLVKDCPLADESIHLAVEWSLIWDLEAKAKLTADHFKPPATAMVHALNAWLCGSGRPDTAMLVHTQRNEMGWFTTPEQHAAWPILLPCLKFSLN